MREGLNEMTKYKAYNCCRQKNHSFCVEGWKKDANRFLWGSEGAREEEGIEMFYILVVFKNNIWLQLLEKFNAKFSNEKNLLFTNLFYIIH